MSERHPSWRVFGTIGARCVWEGLWRGAVYGLLYGTLVGAGLSRSLLGAAYGLFVGAVIGIIAGVLLGVADGVLLGAFRVWRRRNLAAETSPGRAAGRWGCRRTFLRIAVTATTLGGLIVFPVVVSWLMPGTLSGWFVPLYVLAPSLIAGVAAYQAGTRVAAWQETQGEDAPDAPE